MRSFLLIFLSYAQELHAAFSVPHSEIPIVAHS